MALTQVSSEGIKDAQVKTADILDANITTAKVADNAITGAKVADNLDIPDNNKIRFGTGNDLQIFHDGTDSYINSRTGNLYLAPTTSTENGITVVPNGEVRLYYDNSKKFETTANGVTIDGGSNISMDSSSNGQLKVNGSGYSGSIALDGSAMNIYHNSSSRGIVFGIDETEKVNIDTSGFLNIPNDSGRLRLGTGADLQIYHDGSHSRLKNNTGWLVSESDNNQWQDLNGDIQIQALLNGAVNLYYNGVKKFETTADGFSAPTGIDLPDNQSARFGASNDLIIYHDGTDSIIDNNTGALHVKSNTSIAMLVNNTEDAIVANANSEVKLYYDNVKKFETTSDGCSFTGVIKNENDGTAHRLTLGAANDFNFYHDGSNSYIGNNVGDIIIQNTGGNTSNQIYIRGKEGVDSIRADGNGGTYIYDQGSGSAILKISTNNTFGTILSNTTDDANYTNVLTLARRGYEASGYGVNFKAKGGSSSGQNGLLLQVSQGSGGYSDKFTFDNDGLKFGSDTAAANALSDYEEGTFTATMANSVTLYTDYDDCTYVKVGNLVTVAGELRVNDANGGSLLKLTNLPFATKSQGTVYPPGAMRTYNLPLPSGYTYCYCQGSPGNSNLYFGAGKENGVTDVYATANGYFSFTYTYLSN